MHISYKLPFYLTEIKDTTALIWMRRSFYCWNDCDMLPAFSSSAAWVGKKMCVTMCLLLARCEMCYARTKENSTAFPFFTLTIHIHAHSYSFSKVLYIASSTVFFFYISPWFSPSSCWFPISAPFLWKHAFKLLFRVHFIDRNWELRERERGDSSLPLI